MNTTTIILYGILAAIIGAAFYFAPPVSALAGGIVYVKYALLLTLILFVCYTIYCSYKENFFKSVKKVWGLHWGRQVTIDLYIGLLIQFFLVYLTEKSLILALMWLVPTLVYGNIIPLTYFVTHFEMIVAPFLR